MFSPFLFLGDHPEWDIFPRVADPTRRKALTTAVLATTLVVLAPQVPKTEYQDGWRSEFSQPSAHLAPKRSVALLDAFSLQQADIFDDAGTQFLGWNIRWDPPSRLATRSPALLNSTVDPLAANNFPEPQARGWQWIWPEPMRRKPQASTGSLATAFTDQAQATATPTQIGFYSQFNDPVRALSKHATLTDGTARRGFLQIIEAPSQGWQHPFNDGDVTRAKSNFVSRVVDGAARRSMVSIVEAPNAGWRFPWIEATPKRGARNPFGDVAWDPQVLVVVQFQDGWRNQFSEPPALLRAKSLTAAVRSASSPVAPPGGYLIAPIQGFHKIRVRQADFDIQVAAHTEPFEIEVRNGWNIRVREVGFTLRARSITRRGLSS